MVTLQLKYYSPVRNYKRYGGRVVNPNLSTIRHGRVYGNEINITF